MDEITTDHLEKILSVDSSSIDVIRLSYLLMIKEWS